MFQLIYVICWLLLIENNCITVVCIRMGSAVFVHPLEVLKFRMQLSGEKGATSDHRSSIHAIINLAKKEKLSGFYKGITANFVRQLVFTSTRVGCYTSLVDELKKWANIEFRSILSICKMDVGRWSDRLKN